jgi:hypothetical protein
MGFMSASLLARPKTPLSEDIPSAKIPPASCSEDPVLKSRPKSGYPDWGLSWFSLGLPGKWQDSTLKLGHDRFLLNSFQFIIHLSPYHYDAT